MTPRSPFARSLDLAAPEVVERPAADPFDGYLGLLLFCSSLAIYLRTVAPTVCLGDSGELVTAVALLGVPHPTGFPLYLLLGKLFTLVFPFGDLAFRLNVLSALCGAATAAAIFYLVRGLGQSKLVALFAGAFLAFTPTLWDHSTEAKVYAMAAFFLTAALALAVHGAGQGSGRLASLACLAAGLAAATHLNGALALPGVAAILLGARRRLPRRRSFWPGCGLLFLLPLLLYLYIPLRAAAGPELNWSRPDSLERFAFYVTQGQWSYKELARTPLQAAHALGRALSLLAGELTPAGLFLAGLGGWILWRRRRSVLLGLATVLLLNLALVVAYGNQEDIHLLYRYLLPAVLAGGTAMALGVQYLAGLAAHHVVGVRRVPARIFSTGAGLLLLAVVAGRCLLLYPLQDKSAFYTAVDHGRNILSTLPQQGELIGFHYLDLFPLLYLTRVEGLRPDVRLHDRAGNLFGPEYTVYEHRGLPPEELIAHLDEVDARIIAAARGPVFYTQRLNRRVRLEAAGILLAVQGSGWAGDGEALFRGYRLRNEGQFGRGRIWQESRQIAAAYHLYRADMLLSRGQRQGAEQEYLLGAGIGHDSKWALRYAATRLAAGGWTVQAERLGRQAVDLDPADAAPRLELGALLHHLGRHEEALVEYRACLRLGAPAAVVHNNLGTILAALGRREEAIAHLRQALEIDPRHEEARRNLDMLTGGAR